MGPTKPTWYQPRAVMPPPSWRPESTGLDQAGADLVGGYEGLQDHSARRVRVLAGGDGGGQGVGREVEAGIEVEGAGEGAVGQGGQRRGGALGGGSPDGGLGLAAEGLHVAQDLLADRQRDGGQGDAEVVQDEELGPVEGFFGDGVEMHG